MKRHVGRVHLKVQSFRCHRCDLWFNDANSRKHHELNQHGRCSPLSAQRDNPAHICPCRMAEIDAAISTAPYPTAFFPGALTAPFAPPFAPPATPPAALLAAPQAPQPASASVTPDDILANKTPETPMADGSDFNWEAAFRQADGQLDICLTEALNHEPGEAWWNEAIL